MRTVRVTPTDRSGRPCAASFDEDELTLAVSAIERLWEDGPPLGTPGRILLVGDLPPSADTDLPRFLGGSAGVERHGTGTLAARAAFESAVDAGRGTEPCLVVAVEIGSRESDLTAEAADAAVAVWVADRPGPGIAHASSEGPAPRSAVEELARRAGVEASGPGTPSPNDARTARASGAELPLRPGQPVSQGAYVPRPRYAEGLRSHWRFVGEQCGACGTLSFPTRGRCRNCGGTTSLTAVDLPRQGGEVVASTTVGPGGQPTEFDDQVARSGPYGVVLVELAPGARVTLQVTDARPGELGVGARVGTSLRRLYPMEGEWRYGRKAVPLR